MSSPPARFKTYEEFWRFCKSDCSSKSFGCANTCAYRLLLRIPPFGKKYVFNGEVGWRLKP